MFIIVMVLNSCSVTNKIATKPFVIVSKTYFYTDKHIIEYRFIDSSGKNFMFYDYNKSYNIGDTIR